MIRQDQHIILKRADQWMKGGVMDIGCVTSPSAYQPQLVEDETQLTAHNPSMVRKAFLSNLSLTSPLTIGVQQFYSIAIGNTQHRRFCQKNVPSSSDEP